MYHLLLHLSNAELYVSDAEFYISNTELYVSMPIFIVFNICNLFFQKNYKLTVSKLIINNCTLKCLFCEDLNIAFRIE